MYYISMLLPSPRLQLSQHSASTPCDLVTAATTTLMLDCTWKGLHQNSVNHDSMPLMLNLSHDKAWALPAIKSAIVAHSLYRVIAGLTIKADTALLGNLLLRYSGAALSTSRQNLSSKLNQMPPPRLLLHRTITMTSKLAAGVSIRQDACLNPRSTTHRVFANFLINSFGSHRPHFMQLLHGSTIFLVKIGFASGSSSRRSTIDGETHWRIW